MGVLRIIGIPVRRLLHDADFANAIIDSKKTILALWGVFSEHAFGAIIITILYLFLLAVTFALVLAAISYVAIPLQSVREWQKKKVNINETDRKKLPIICVIFLTIVLMVIADSIWSNISAFSLYGAGDKAVNMITTIDKQIVLVDKATAEAQRFMTGLTGVLMQAAVGGNDVRPILRVVDDLLSELKVFLEYTKYEARVLADRLKSPDIDELARKMLENAVPVIGINQLDEQLRSLNSLLEIFQGSTENKGMLAIRSLIPSFEQIRPSIAQVDSMVKSLELGRFLGVFTVLSLLIGATAAGIQFFRMKRFRLVSIFLVLICVVICGIEILGIGHLIIGTLFGAFCDGVMGTGNQKPIIVLNTPELSLTMPNLYKFTSSCSEGADITGALMGTFAKEDKLVTLGNSITIDAQHKEVIINTGPVVVAIPVENNRGDLKKAIDKTIEVLFKESSSQILAYAQKASEMMKKATGTSQKFDIAAIVVKLDNLKVMLSTIDSVEAPKDVIRLLQQIKVDTGQKVDRIIGLLNKLQSQKDQIEPAIDAIISFLSTATRTPEDFIQSIQQALRTNMHPFLANTLQPALECKELGTEVQSLMNTACGSGSAFQSLFVALALLLTSSIAIATFLFICRKFCEEQETIPAHPTC